MTTGKFVHVDDVREIVDVFFGRHSVCAERKKRDDRKSKWNEWSRRTVRKMLSDAGATNNIREHDDVMTDRYCAIGSTPDGVMMQCFVAHDGDYNFKEKK